MSTRVQMMWIFKSTYYICHRTAFNNDQNGLPIQFIVGFNCSQHDKMRNNTIEKFSDMTNDKIINKYDRQQFIRQQLNY